MMTRKRRPASPNQRQQWATELRHIELFLRLANLEPDIEPGDRPDCVLVFSDRRVGLEHRELYDEGLQANRPHLERFKEALGTELARRALRLHVQVHFPMYSTYLRDHPSEVRPLAHRVADLAVANDSKVTTDADVVVREDELEALALKGPTLLAFQRMENAPGPTVQVQGGPVLGEGAHRVEAAVREKEAKLPSYAPEGRFSEMWLLLVTGESITQTVVSRLIEDLKIESSFDRIYVLDTAEQKVRCVR